MNTFDKLLPFEIQRPETPRPISFAFRHRADPYELGLLQEDRQRYFERIKRKAAGALADHIAEHCKWFDVSIPQHDPYLTLQLELTIEDRGAYVNYAREARTAGFSDGWARAQAACAASLPYGVADAAQEFYE
jgi:hypothetical protein